MQKTLVFCTSYADSEQLWTLRYRLWLNAIRSSAIIHDHILIVDDGSPVLPEWPDVTITGKLDDPPGTLKDTLYHFTDRLGRQAGAVYPGWFRSFCFGARFAEKHGFEKVVHIESDGFIISRRMQDYINAVTDDWIAPAIQSHAMPESAIQIMAGSGLQSYVEFSRKPYSDVVGIEAENVLPLTKVERDYVGSRYGEKMDFVPHDADFVTQTNPSKRGQPDYYWWIPRNVLPF